MSTPDILLEHEADGIREYDNPLPAWWLGIFYGTIIFSVVFIPYLVIAGWGQAKQYDEEIAAATQEFAAANAAGEQKALAFTAPTPQLVAAGKLLFEEKCVACHMQGGIGGIGPNLIDTTWIHGGSYMNIQKTVRDGVVEKGMLAWGPILGPEGVGQVAAYVHSLGGGQ